jgi:hypothetical protein
MNLAQLLYIYRRPYAWLLYESIINNILLQSRRLDFDMEAQTQSNWCWAATSTSVSHFYWSWSNWTQCLVANGELGRNDCCGGNVPAACNVPWYLDLALTRTNNFVSYTGVASFETVKAEIDAGRPVGARIGWNNGGGHFVVIYGYSIFGGEQYFNIDDPIYGKSQLTVADFTSNYQGSGSWTHTYMTKSYFPIIIFKPLYIRDPILKIVWESRPLLNPARGGQRQGEEPDEAWRRSSLALAHRVYVLGLNEFRKKKVDISAATPVAVRVLESAEGQLQALFDVTDDEAPRVQQMSASRTYLDKLSRGLDQAISLVQEYETGEETRGKKEEQNAERAELRLLRIPALNFEALWLHSEGEEADRLVPILSLGVLAPFEPVSMEEALEALHSEASALAEMDDRMGA